MSLSRIPVRTPVREPVQVRAFDDDPPVPVPFNSPPLPLARAPVTPIRTPVRQPVPVEEPNGLAAISGEASGVVVGGLGGALHHSDRDNRPAEPVRQEVAPRPRPQRTPVM